MANILLLQAKLLLFVPQFLVDPSLQNLTTFSFFWTLFWNVFLRVSVITSLYLILEPTPNLTLMTFAPQIRVKGHDGSLLKNHEVFLMISGINATINHTLVTDNDGLASFKLDTVHWNGTDISLQVSTGVGQLPSKEDFLKEKLKNVSISFLPLPPHL